MKFESCEAEALYDFLILDPARHYFMCHTMDAHKSFRGAWRLMDQKHIQIAVFLRHTGLIQVAIAPRLNWKAYKDAFIELLEAINWQQAMVIETVKQQISGNFEGLEVSEGAKIMMCTPERFQQIEETSRADTFEIRPLDESDLDEVVMIYQEVFTGFASRTYMADKLQKRKGRAYGGFINGQLIAVAQSDYESHQHALIVGVATVKSFQRKGYGKRIFKYLCEMLVSEGKVLYLQYDSVIAGEMYKHFGFIKLDQIYHIRRMAE